MAAQLAATVYVTDPDSHQTVELAEGTSPEPHLAALVTNPGAWVDGKLPRLPKAQPEGKGTSETSEQEEKAAGDGDQAATSDTEDDQQTASAAKKPAARRTAATRPARGRTAAAEGDSGE